MAERPMNRSRKPRKKVCGFCVDKVENIDYKDIARLRRYMSERGSQGASGHGFSGEG